MELGLIANVCHLVHVKDEELDGIEDREDAHHEGQHPDVHFILVLPEHLLQEENHEDSAEPASVGQSIKEELETKEMQRRGDCERQKQTPVRWLSKHKATYH